MVRSEIFDNYAKLAEEKGLIKKAYPNSDEVINKVKDGRRGSDDISTIEALYGVQPNGKEDETSIIEKAHPDTKVISQSYDRMNGVVENVIERHNIMTDIALRPADGNLTGKRYVRAKTNLLNSLLKAATLLDSQNEVELMNLADSCSETLIKEADFLESVKEFGGAIPGILGGAGIAGATALGLIGPVGWAIAAVPIGLAIFNNIRPASQGVLNDAKNALTQLNEAKSSVPKAKNVIDATIDLISDFLPYAERYMQTEPPEAEHAGLDMAGAMQIKNDPQEMNKIKIQNQYLAKCRDLKTKLSSIIMKLKASEDERDQSNLPKGLDYVSKLLTSIWTPAVKDAYLALETLDNSLGEVLNKSHEATQEAQGTSEKIIDELKDWTNKHKPSFSNQEETPKPKDEGGAAGNPAENFFKQLNQELHGGD